MSHNPQHPLYPDVLGAITGGTRINLNDLQIAVGVFPKRAYINQSFEAVLILQNMVDQNMKVKVAIHLPTEDKAGNPVVIDAAQKMMTLGLRPGEVGVLRTPFVARPPTKPTIHLPVRLAVRYRTPQAGTPVRPPTGGAPPSVLSVSSFTLQTLRDIEFIAHPWRQSTDIVTTYFDILPKVLPFRDEILTARYDTLWTHEEMREELAMVETKLTDAKRVATYLTRNTVYDPIYHAVDERFGNRGLYLHPGEIAAIAKLITYTLDEGLILEPGFSLEESRWFQTLCQVLAHDPSIEDWDKGTLVTRYLFEAALFDAILLGFHLVKSKVKEDLGSHDEQVSYANRILEWYAGRGQPDISYIYLPLAMGALTINELVRVRGHNPWTLLDDMNEALRGRARLFTGESITLFDMTTHLLKRADDALRRSRILRS